MSNEMIRHGDAVALEFTAEQRQMIRDTFANGCSDAEFAVLMEIARVRRLNPMLRQVYFVQRWDKAKSRMVWATQVSIDGLRAIAERTGLYEGQDEPEFTDDANGRPRVCKVRVHRKGWSRPACGVAYFSECVQTTKDGTPTQFWQKMPHTMLAKVAEAFAIRKAFPEDTANLYTNEEMPPEDGGDERRETPRPAIDATPSPLTLPRDNGPSPSQAAAPKNDLPPEHEAALEEFYARVAEIELPGEAIVVWMKHRAALSVIVPRERENAWKAICSRVEEVGRMKNAKVWLKKAIADEDARRMEAESRPEPDDDGGPTKPRRGPRKTPQGEGAADSPAATPGASTGSQEGPAAWLATEADTAEHARGLATGHAVEASARKHNAALAATPWGVRVYAERLAALEGASVDQCARYVVAWCKHGPKGAATAQRRAA